mgnify:CR=1 FL=1
MFGLCDAKFMGFSQMQSCAYSFSCKSQGYVNRDEETYVIDRKSVV